MLTVVDHEQQAPSGHRFRHGLDDRHPALGGDPEGAGQGVGDGVGSAGQPPPGVGNSSARHSAAASASLVLPTPPAPVSVTSRCVRTRSAIDDSSSSRPMRVVAALGRLPRRTSRFTSAVWQTSGRVVCRRSLRQPGLGVLLCEPPGVRVQGFQHLGAFHRVPVGGLDHDRVFDGTAGASTRRRHAIRRPRPRSPPARPGRPRHAPAPRAPAAHPRPTRRTRAGCPGGRSWERPRPHRGFGAPARGPDHTAGVRPTERAVLRRARRFRSPRSEGPVALCGHQGDHTSVALETPQFRRQVSAAGDDRVHAEAGIQSAGSSGDDDVPELRAEATSCAASGSTSAMTAIPATTRPPRLRPSMVTPRRPTDEPRCGPPRRRRRPFAVGPCPDVPTGSKGSWIHRVEQDRELLAHAQFQRWVEPVTVGSAHVVDQITAREQGPCVEDHGVDPVEAA